MHPVVYASYGGACVTKQVRHRFDQKGALAWGASQYHTWMGDPFPGAVKTFLVVSRDGSTTPPRMRVNIFEDEEPINLIPGPGPSDERRKPPMGTEIVAANYGGQDVTATVRALWAQQGHLNFDTPDARFGDPIPGVVKALVVTYLTTKNKTPHRESAFYFDGEHVLIGHYPYPSHQQF